MSKETKSLFPKPLVGGSIPSRPTIPFNNLRALPKSAASLLGASSGASCVFGLPRTSTALCKCPGAT